MFVLPIIITTIIVATDVRIEQVLPDTSIVVVSITNAATFGKHVQESGLCDSFHEMAKIMMSDVADDDSCPLTNGWDQLMATMGIDNGEMPALPSGHIGWGVYPVFDDESGSVGLGMMGFVELGDSKWGEIIEQMFQGEVLEQFDVEEVDIAGHTVWVVSGFMPDDIPVQPMNIDPSSFNRLYLALSDGYFVIGSEPDGISTALAAFEGDFESDALEHCDVYNGVMNRLAKDDDLYAVLLLTNLVDTIVQMDQTGMAMMFLPMVKTTFGDVDALAESVSLIPSHDVLLEATYVAFMGDGRNGLLGLIGEDTPRVSIPNFIPEETLSYSQMQIDLDKVAPLVKEIIASNPMIAMQFGQQMEQVETILTQALAPLGSQCHFVSTGQLPITATSLGYLAAIECTDEEVMGTFLNQTLPMLGATPSDFLGNQLFTIDLTGGMMVPIDISISFAVGGGFVFIGTTHSVESALRSIANPTTRQSSMVVPTGDASTSAWGFSDLRKSIEFQTEFTKHMTVDLFSEMDEFDPEMAAEMRKEFEDSQLLQKEILNSLVSFLGSMNWELHANDTGFTSRVTVYRPED